MYRQALLVLLTFSTGFALACAESAVPTAPSSSTSSTSTDLSGSGPPLAVTSGAAATQVAAQVQPVETGPDLCRRDETFPSLFVELSESQLWPPNRQMVDVTATVTVSDNCDPTPTVTLVSIESSEPESGLGGWDRPGDIQNADFGTDDRTFSLRAERSKAVGGREYRVVYQAADAAGNAINFGPVLVYVPVKANQANF